MFDVYLNEKRDRLLVIARGQPIPVVENAGRWRKKKATIAVSDGIKSAVQRDGFYWRRLHKTNSLPNKKATSPLAARRPSRNNSRSSRGALVPKGVGARRACD
jgi:hypothetical protein